MTIQLTIDHCLQDDVEALNILLEEQGAISVTLTDRYDTPILEPQLGTTPLWADVVIQALFVEEEDAESAALQLSAHFPTVQVGFEHLPEQDWERVCMADFKPQQFGRRLWICPSWLTPPDPTAINLTLDPGLAFGTGTHPTTSLCLTWLEQADVLGKRVIDYGCGSGVLALASLKLGAQHVDAVDLDEQALIATRNNALSNAFSFDELTVCMPDALNDPVDVLMANILLSPLLTLKTEFRRLLKPGGQLVVSGLLNDQKNQLIEEYNSDFTYQTSSSQGDWCLVVFS
jgi:ribosomal protein L11 methyltransferase